MSSNSTSNQKGTGRPCRPLAVSRAGGQQSEDPSELVPDMLTATL